MCFSIYNQKSVMKLCMAAQGIQRIIDDGTLPEAFDKNRNGEAHRAVVAFDMLAKAAAAVAEEHKEVSPFLRYRREALADGHGGATLRQLVRSLAGSEYGLIQLGLLLTNLDEHHTRIALEMIAGYMRHTYCDAQFKALASEIVEMVSGEAQG